MSTKSKKDSFLIILAASFLIFAFAVYVSSDVSFNKTGDKNESSTYTVGDFGFSFEYPSSFLVYKFEDDYGKVNSLRVRDEDRDIVIDIEKLEEYSTAMEAAKGKYSSTSPWLLDWLNPTSVKPEEIKVGENEYVRTRESISNVEFNLLRETYFFENDGGVYSIQMVLLGDNINEKNYQMSKEVMDLIAGSLLIK